MHHLSRFGVSLEEDLLAAFDLSIGGMGYQNRSEAIRDLIRDHLIQKKVGQSDTEVIGVVTLVYDHRVHHLGDLLADMQHKADVAVNASLHIHLDEHNCLEVIVIRGRADKVHRDRQQTHRHQRRSKRQAGNHDAGNEALNFFA